MSGGATRIVLASASSARIALLRNAGVAFAARSAPVDERAVEAPLIAANVAPREIAVSLAAAKALAAGAADPDALTIGADQVLEWSGRRWTKPGSLAEARLQLGMLSGTTHALHSAVAVARGGAIAWRHVDTAILTMRPISEGFLESYLAAIGPDALKSVGAYQIEGLGIQLFERIEGDYFTILGLPLLPLLDYLRRAGGIAR